MTAMRFVDTNVALYAVSLRPIEAVKRQVSLDLLSESYGKLAVSVQVLGEFYYQATRPSRTDSLSHEEAVEVVEDLKRLYVQPLTVETVDRALSYQQRYRLNYWDCLILAAAKQSGCEVVFSEDMSASQDYDGLRVVNPFES